MNIKARYSPKSRRGVAAVEFALVAPLFFMFVFGIIEFGWMVMVQQVITNARGVARADCHRAWHGHGNRANPGGNLPGQRGGYFQPPVC